MSQATAQKLARILIVDDDKANIALLEGVLKDQYDVLSAMGGQRAVDLAKTELPDLILLDVMMPEIDGFQVCQSLQDDPTTAGIPVIFLSADGDTKNKVRALDMGAVDYMTKPFDRNEILARAKRHLKSHGGQQSTVAELNAKLGQIRDAQQRLLVSPRDLPEAGFGVSFLPMNEAGGDFYDVMAITEDTFGYFVADVSGHDLAASFNTSAIKVLLHQYADPAYSAIETIKHLNTTINSVMDSGMHLTACYATLNRQSGQLQVVSAGHPPVIYIAAGGRPQTFQTNGDVLGAFDDVTFEPAGRTVAKGDRFFIYSDGLIETTGQSPDDRAEGIRRLSQACYDKGDLPITSAVETVCSELLADLAGDRDDVVLLGVEV